MKKVTCVILTLFIFLFSFSSAQTVGEEASFVGSTQYSGDTIPELIPVNRNGKLGYLNSQSKKTVIAPEYSLALFFNEDCNLKNSPNEEVREFGSEEYATVKAGEKTYRIDKKGNKVYTYKPEDIGTCSKQFLPPRYSSYKENHQYGIVKKDRRGVPDAKQIYIQPIYQYTFVLDSKDKENPMIIAVQNDKFGVLDKNGKVILPFVFEDIKKNLAWRDANLFSVSMDGKNYYYVDQYGNEYK